MPSDQNQGNYNPEYMETAPVANRSGSRQFELEEDPQHPTSPTPSSRPQDKSDPYGRMPTDMPPGETPSSSSAGSRELKEGGVTTDAEGEKDSYVSTDAWLISKAHEIYTTSTDYLDANITNIWEVNLAHFTMSMRRRPSSGHKITNDQKYSVLKRER